MTTRTCSSAFLFATVLGSAALAQGPSTATNYAVFATDGTTTSFDSRAAGTAVGFGLGVHARVGGGMFTLPSAWAATFVGNAAVFGSGRGVAIHETGGVDNTGATGTFTAGTSADAPGTAAPTQGAHDITMHFPVAAATQGTVTIVWQARQSAGASVTGAVDVDGDGTPDWTGTGASSDHTTIGVTAGSNGVTILSRTSGSASVTGTGHEGYGAALTVLFAPASGSSLTFTWTANGPQCLGSLAGTAAVQPFGGVRLDFTVAGGAPNGIGLLFLGQAAANPLNLPVGSCQLLVDPANAGLSFFLTDGSGNATTSLRTRARPMTVDFQALTLGFASGALGTTNALDLVVQ